MPTNAAAATSLSITFTRPLCPHLRDHLAEVLDAVFLDEDVSRGTIGYVTPGWRLCVTSEEPGSFKVVCHPSGDTANLTSHAWLKDQIRAGIAGADGCAC